MDYRLFAPGTTAWFPVSVPGALFYLGLIRTGQDISAIRSDLPFGEPYCADGRIPEAA